MCYMPKVFKFTDVAKVKQAFKAINKILFTYHMLFANILFLVN